MEVIWVMKRFNIFLIAFIFLAGCSNNGENNTPPKELSLPIQKSIQDWTVSLISKSNMNDQPVYEFELTYKGDTKAENILIQTGSAKLEAPAIENDQIMRIESSYASDVKQLDVTVSRDKGDKAFKQTVLFDVE
jgi:hypothetical protein